MADTTLIRLGIDLNYPVNWSMTLVLRDFMQNFFDSVGSSEFYDKVSLRYILRDTYTLIIETYDVPFSYEWLIHIGGTTKTGNSGRYIGKYGEGFKICILRLVQLGIMDCRMESRDWVITPCTYSEEIDNNRIEMLGYRLASRIDDGYTRLTINGIPTENKRILEELKLHFFYPKNPLFSEKILKEKGICVYKRSKMQCPSENVDSDFKGILYLNHLARARLDAPVAINICLTSYEIDDRNRHVINPYHAKTIITKALPQLSSSSSLALLEELSDFWADLPKKERDVETWYYIICILVRNIAADQTTAEKFKKNHKGLRYIDRINMRDSTLSSHASRKLINETRRWAGSMGIKKGDLVNPIFRFLGARSLVDEYLSIRIKDFRSAEETEEAKIALLFSALETVFPIPFLYDVRPQILMSVSHDILYDPLLYSERDRSKRIRKYRISKLVLSPRLLKSSDFSSAFVDFCEIMLSVLGSDRSEMRGIALTMLAERLIDLSDAMKIYSDQWESMFKQVTL